MSPHELSQVGARMKKTYIEHKEIKQEGVLPRRERTECLELRQYLILLSSPDFHALLPTQLPPYN